MTQLPSGFRPWCAHAATNTEKYGDWTITDSPKWLMLGDIKSLLSEDKLQTLQLSDIAWKGKKDLTLLQTTGSRYRKADPTIPGIVALDGPNPYKDKYRMLDGKHRIHKLVSAGTTESKFYVLNFKDIEYLFKTEVEKENYKKHYYTYTTKGVKR